MPGYYSRQTCLNGHIISNSVGTPHGNAHMQSFCGDCGEQTIVDCPSCHQPQHGNLRDVLPSGNSTPDSYCWNCGVPYPWTDRQLKAAAELVNEDEQLSESDKELLTATFVDMTSETSRTTLAATRFKRLVTKAGKGLGDALQKTLVDVLSETAKKFILGS